MLTKFWESIGSDFAKKWLEHIFGPAFLFWGGGFALYAWKTGWKEILVQVQSLTIFQQGSLIILSLLVLVFSSLLAQSIRFSVLRGLEGYWPWPFSYFGFWIISLRKRHFQKKYNELRHLKVSESKGKLTDKEAQKLIQLDIWAHWHPVKAKDILPTTLGNTLRARERTPERRYGLDAVVCWPRLWSLLPENVRSDLINARFSLDRLVEIWFWGLLFLLWNFLTPWSLVISVVWMILAYSMIIQAAMAYGELFEAAFDLHRMSLYDALAWASPKNSEEEKILGGQLTEFLWRGTLPNKINYKK